nr:unnamed protein product [Callosobruchus chinensis]
MLDAVQRRAIRLIGIPALTYHLQPLSHRRADSDRVSSQVLCELCDALDYAHLSSLLLDNFQIRAFSSAQGRTIEDDVFRSFNCLPALPAQKIFQINPQFLQEHTKRPVASYKSDHLP